MNGPKYTVLTLWRRFTLGMCAWSTALVSDTTAQHTLGAPHGWVGARMKYHVTV